MPLAPIRGELLGAEKLAQRASALARARRTTPNGTGWRGAPLLARLDETRAILDDAHQRLAVASAEDVDVGPAGEWLLDNFHVVQAHIREVRESLPRHYYRELPELTNGHLAGYPRVYEMATTLIAHTEGRISGDSIELFVGAFQREVTLSLGELWALPAMLRVGLIENVRRMALRTKERLDEVREADRWAGRIHAASEAPGGALGVELNEFVANHPQFTAIFVARFLQQMRLRAGAFTPLAWLEQWLAEDGLNSEQAGAQSSQRAALTQVVMANSITSLRTIAHLDWRSFVEHQSAMEAVLREDPSGFYPRMTFATRDEYRHVVERVAKRTGLDEATAARHAIDLARTGMENEHGAGASPASASACGHVGYYLVDDGRPELDRVTSYRATFGERIHRSVLRHPNAIFVGGIALLTVAVLLLVVSVAGPATFAVSAAVALLALIPAAEVAVSLVNQLVTNFLPPRVLPKLELRDPVGIPAEYRTVVIVPTLFDQVETVRSALEHLEVQFLANRTAHLHFAILSDFVDSLTETCPDDDAIVAAAAEGVRALNARYVVDGDATSRGEAPREKADTIFFLFHRPRRWNPQQGVWMGWERKRGKIAEFNHFLRRGSDGGADGKAEGQNPFSTIVGDVDVIRHARYVITLDADTVLPPEAGPLLIGAMAHPLNRAVCDAARGFVARGYGIIQPRVGIVLPSAFRSWFAAIHSGHPGVDPYTTAVSDVYQDLYGEGSYTGKGIYDIDAFEWATHGRFPENRLLSHDLIEGNYARAALATDIEVYDEYPARYLSYTRRKHRWIRGDWQLLEWLTSRVPGPNGPEPNRLSLLSRWKILDNLRRSTVEIAQLLLLIAGWTILPGSPVRWTAVALLMLTAPWIFAVILAALRPPLDKSWRAYYGGVWDDARTSALQVILAIAFLPHQAWVSADAIVRTLWRLFVTKKKLLEWQTSSHAERTTLGTASEAWRTMWPALAIATAILAVILRAGAGDHTIVTRLAAAVPLLALWAISPAVARALNASPVPRKQRLSAAQQADMLRYAGLHWTYFDRFVTEDTNWLVPDNFQEEPEPLVAMRTSPTNIGLQLLAIVSAHDLGFIALDAMVDRIELVLRSLERMRRFHGHFYNWYDLRDLRVLEPAYISTVDSGNLAGHMLAVRQACLAFADAVSAKQSAAAAGETPALIARLRAIAERAYLYAVEMDFGFLFDDERMLFSIGYQETAHTFDPSYYDLLASESRLASFIAIAKDDVLPEHWFRLGRALVRAAGETALVSWSGSMFEYLMPLLVMESFPGTVLDRTYGGAVRRHQSYGGEHRVPWGMSESAYNVRDRHSTYQYRAFGVPDLALKRGLGRDLVVAPYASALALMVDPHRALANLAALERQGSLGAYGFRDSIDYTRPDPGAHFSIVRTYMAHHIGMSLVALTNGLRANVWQRRFHAEPLVRAVEVLLHERIPRRHEFQDPQSTLTDEALPNPELERPAVREAETAETPQPVVALLGALPYTIMVSNCGGGYSRYEKLAVTRWRADGTRDHTGQFCYIKDLSSDRVWSAAHQPVCAPADEYRALLATDRVTFHRVDGPIETKMEIAVVAADAAEIRRVTLTNHARETRELEVTSYGEIVLANPDADRAHPAFGNLFVETEWHAWCTAITATRRPRSADEPRLWLVHVVDAAKERVGTVTCETDRARFLGRGRSPANPIALDHDGALSGTTGEVLDPVFALRTRVRLEPGQTASVAFTTLVATTRERAFELADRYDDPHAAQRAFDLAWSAAQIELRELSISPADAAVYQDLAGNLFYSNPALRAPYDELLRNRGSQPLLWSIGLSGDWPILLATVTTIEGLSTVRQLLAAHQYWRRRGMMTDLVVLNAFPSTYLGELNDKITALLLGSTEAGVIDRPGGVFLRRRDQIEAHALLMLRATARVHIECDGRPLGRIIETAPPPTDDSDGLPAAAVDEPLTHAPRPLAGRKLAPIERIVRRLRAVGGNGNGDGDADAIPTDRDRRSALAGHRHQRQHETSLHLPARATDQGPPLLFDNGIGGLTPEGDYEIRLHDGSLPPAPWGNVIANERGGFLVTEQGGGYTWTENSQFYRLTPWHNDPVSDPASELLYLRDEDTGEVWSATPASYDDAQSYTVRHGVGTTSFEHDHDGLASRLTLGMPEHESVKLSILRLTNEGSSPRRISITAYVEWLLGVLREHAQHQVNTEFDVEHGAILARNTFDPQFAEYMAFCAMSEPVASYTSDRREFLGRNGSTGDPAGMREATLTGRSGAGLDPCAALRCVVELDPNESHELVVVLGAANGEDAARRLVAEYRDLERAKASLAHAVDAWERRLSVIRVRTPDAAFDAMVNRWTLYQALSCRMWGRSALYQSGGAYGFRDQLQDVMAFVYAEPAIAREHIVRAAGRQFVEGDVQHWWHVPSGRGVRTRFSDDLVWLPFVVEHYVRVTGDASVLGEDVPFLSMRVLQPHEHEVYDLPEVSSERASIYEHCLRALRRASTSGPHGLPLMGGGDWNDGMNRVGVEGRGESVWLAWFLISTLRSFASLADARGERATADDLRRQADAYTSAVEASAWDGAWYRRAYYDDGTPLGSASNDECRIDAIAQSWSVISGAGEPSRQATAMRSWEEHLVRNDARLLLLLTPPFDKTPLDPGYIKGYLPGIRENGAQYTHAGLWGVLATALLGDADRAFELYQMINPLMRSRTPEDVEIYQVEPYVVAADIYTAPAHVGRGGWTWYTGSASWMYRIGLETILGFTRRGDTLVIEPRVPHDWPELTIEYRFGSSQYTIVVRDAASIRHGGAEVSVDGRLLDGATIPLVDDGAPHEVVVRARAAVASESRPSLSS